jgi:hypothetical protein
LSPPDESLDATFAAPPTIKAHQLTDDGGQLRRHLTTHPLRQRRPDAFIPEKLPILCSSAQQTDNPTIVGEKSSRKHRRSGHRNFRNIAISHEIVLEVASTKSQVWDTDG